MENKKFAVLSLSGGLDSSTLLLKLLSDGYNVQCISFNIGQRHVVELERAKELCHYILMEQVRVTGGSLTKCSLSHKIIKLEGLSELLVSGLIDNNSMELKKGHYAHENALTSVVPNRNAIFASIIYAVALSIVKKTGQPCKIALGTHMGDFDNNKKAGIYPDCSEEFRQAIEHAFKIGNWDSEKVDYYAPYNITDKTGVLKDGIECCSKLGLDWKEVYKRTNTSYAPIKVNLRSLNKGPNGEEDCDNFVWYSDYKTGSSVERIISFVSLGLEDPLQYAEEEGTLVSWDTIKNHAVKLEEEFQSK